MRKARGLRYPTIFRASPDKIEEMRIILEIYCGSDGSCRKCILPCKKKFFERKSFKKISDAEIIKLYSILEKEKFGLKLHNK